MVHINTGTVDKYPIVICMKVKLLICEYSGKEDGCIFGISLIPGNEANSECTEVSVMGIQYTSGRHGKVKLGAVLGFSTL